MPTSLQTAKTGRAEMSPESFISNSSIAAVVCNPSLADNPIIACNGAFLALTGYAREEVIGRNCRFLRGERTELQLTAILREAVANARPAMVELVNYRKDGTAFRNAVMIAPLFDETGTLCYFIGSQVLVDAGKADRAEHARGLVAKLTMRQSQILDGLVRGQLNKQIAFDLGLKERTVKMHRAGLLRSLGVRSNAEAIRIAIEASL